jgi:hypothetical protein
LIQPIETWDLQCFASEYSKGMKRILYSNLSKNRRIRRKQLSKRLLIWKEVIDKNPLKNVIEELLEVKLAEDKKILDSVCLK